MIYCTFACMCLNSWHMITEKKREKRGKKEKKIDQEILGLVFSHKSRKLKGYAKKTNCINSTREVPGCLSEEHESCNYPK